MRIVTTVAEMAAIARQARHEGRRISFVPTMGFLHDGHASLLAAARKQGELLVLSIFVNPTQFGPTEDLSTYPRDLGRDQRVAKAEGVDVIFLPLPEEMYPAGFQTTVSVGDLSLPLCGKNRPGHFQGVATVVTKLFSIVQPDVAFFGKKDFQQLAIIRRLVADLNLPVEIIGMPIVREGDGLAMSSRNKYLSPAQRQAALCLSRALNAARDLFRKGIIDVDLLRQEVLAILQGEPNAEIDYADFRQSSTLAEVSQATGETLLALAVRIGSTRLIDNCVLGEEN
ncbi:MAG TPA: pantoate--beta-alanine ligase [Geobacterales bacterium]|nr:pantoate--beta-alanine ligase [Geobacterales bacterium]